MAAATAVHVFSHALQVNLIVHFRRIAGHVELQLFRVAAHLMRLQMELVVEQQVVHLPELTLCTGGFGGLRREQGVRMRRFDGEMTVDDAHLVDESREQELDRLCCLLAGRALEIAVYHDRYRRMRRAERMINRADGRRQLRLVDLTSYDACASSLAGSSI